MVSAEKSRLLRAIVVANGTGSEDSFPPSDRLSVDVVEAGVGKICDLMTYDLLIIPNGTDHVYLYRSREIIREFLDAGNALLCCCGWFLDWVPGNRWVHDNTHPTREVRHLAGVDSHALLNGVDLLRLDKNRHGISGWWACGCIEPAEGAETVIQDTWGRALMVLDEVSTNGCMCLTASGPIGDFNRYEPNAGPLTTIYGNILNWMQKRISIHELSPSEQDCV